MAKSSFKRPAPPGAKGPAKKAPAGAPAKKSPAAPAKPAPKAAFKRPAPPPGVRTNVPPPVEQEELPIIEGEVVGEDTIPEGARVVARDEQQVGFSMMSARVGVPVGEYDAGDFNRPKFKLAQRVGPLVEEMGFTYGDWVLVSDESDGVILFQEGCEPIEVTILLWAKGFMQQTKYGEDMGKLYETSAAAIADGLVPFGGDEVGFVPFQNALVLIKQPEGVESPIFDQEFDKQGYAIALWRITGSAYSAVAKKVNSQLRMRLKGGTHVGSFLVTHREVPGKVNTYLVPVLKDGQLHEQEFIDWAAGLLGN